MPGPLSPCPSCHRHVRLVETSCPFCEVALWRAAVPATRTPGLSRSSAWLSGVALASCLARQSDPPIAAPMAPAPPLPAPSASAPSPDAGAPLEAADAGAKDRHIVPIYGSTSIVFVPEIAFAPLSARIRPEQDAILKELAAILPSVREGQIEVEGHADTSEGARAEPLAEQRARAVYGRLVELGVPKELLVIRVAGTQRPAVPPGSPEARSKNPRVRFVRP